MADLIPDTVKLAAQRAFIRTTAQAYSTSISASLVIAVVDLLVTPGNWLVTVVAVLTALVTPLAAGAAAYFSWIHKGLEGIPSEYENAAVLAVNTAKGPKGL